VGIVSGDRSTIEQVTHSRVICGAIVLNGTGPISQPYKSKFNLFGRKFFIVLWNVYKN
jgi:hypothetical protein